MTISIVKPSLVQAVLLTAALPVLLFSAASRANAQPTLDRVEQQIRRDAAGNPVAGDPAQPVAGVEPGYLGLLADDQQEQGRGIRIKDVVAAGPAANGGLETGDLITAINGRAVKQMDDMTRIMTKLPAGSKVEFVVSRNEGDTPISVTLGKRPGPDQRRLPKFGKQDEQPTGEPGELPPDGGDVGPAPLVPRAAAGNPAPASGPKLGVRTLAISDETRARYQLQSNEGAFVAAVTVGSPAAKAGVPAGSVITSVDGEKVTVPEDLAGIIKRAGVGKEVELVYFNRGQEVTTKVLLAAGAPTANTPTPAAPRPGSADVRPTLRPGEASAARPSRDADRIAELEARVRDLEERLERLESGNREP